MESTGNRCNWSIDSKCSYYKTKSIRQLHIRICANFIFLPTRHTGSHSHKWNCEKKTICRKRVCSEIDAQMATERNEEEKEKKKKKKLWRISMIQNFVTVRFEKKKSYTPQFASIIIRSTIPNNRNNMHQVQNFPIFIQFRFQFFRWYLIFNVNVCESISIFVSLLLLLSLHRLNVPNYIIVVCRIYTNVVVFSVAATASQQ